MITVNAGSAAARDTLQASANSGSSLSRYKVRTLARNGPYRSESRWKTYVAIGKLFDRVWLHPASKKTIKRTNALNAGGAIFELEDRDADGEAEFFVYMPPDGSKRTQDFGAYFDLNADGKSDWIVFYGGIAFTNKVKLFVWHQHGIDTNGDGRFDTRVVGMIDTDGDGLPEKGATAWIYDTDHDGLVDKAEHIVNGRITTIEPIDRALPIGWVLRPDLSEQPRIGEPTAGLFDMIAADIQAALGKQPRPGIEPEIRKD